MVVAAGLLEELAQISEAAPVAGGLLSPTTHNDAQLGGRLSYGSAYLLSNAFEISIHAAMLSSVHLCCNVL